MKQLILLTLTLSLLNTALRAQTCGTPIPANPTIYSSTANARGASSAYCIDVFYHIVRNTNGTNAFTPNNLDDITENLNEFYSPHNIIVNNAGSDFIDNTNFVNIGNDNEAVSLGQTNNHSDAINYYIVETLWSVGTSIVTGTANSIPSNNLVIRNDRTLTSTSPHEFGHCLNLLHTHETAHGTEAIDGSNCANAGDLICDTPADPKLGTGNVSTACVYTGGGGFNPDVNNIMSYSRAFCRDQFTDEQGIRMRTAISEESLLQDVTSNSCVKISKVDNNVCYPGTRTVTLTNLGGATTTWTSSTNVQITSSNNSSATIRAINSSTSGNGWIRATLNDGIELTEEFWVGKPGYSGETIVRDVNDPNQNVSYVYTYSNAVGFYVSVASGADNYQWTITSDQSCGSTYNGPKFQSNGNGTQSTTTSNKINVNTGTCSGYFWIHSKTTNNCGETYYSSRKFRVTNNSGGGGCDYTLSTYPNPSKIGGDITINLVPPPPGCDNSIAVQNLQETSISSSDEILSITLIDNSGNPICAETCSGSSNVLNIDDLKRGIYYLNVQTVEGRTFQTRIIKN